MPKRPPNSRVRRDLVLNAIFDEAAVQFSERGVSRTSLSDIAEALGMSRTALYHYIGSKDALLGDLVRGMSKDAAETLQALEHDNELGPVDRLREAIRSHTLRIASSPVRFRLLLLSEGSLEEPIASEHRAARRQVLDSLANIIRAGVEQGALRPVDPRTSALAILGMCNWVAWWYQPDHDDAPARGAIADEIAELGLASVLVSDARRRGPNGDPIRAAVSLLREDLEHLERSLDTSARSR